MNDETQTAKAKTKYKLYSIMRTYMNTIKMRAFEYIVTKNEKR